MSDLAVEDWLQRQDERMRALIRMARQRIQQAVPGIVESYKAGAPFYGLQADVIYLEPRGKELIVAFVSDLPVPDPDGLTRRDQEFGQYLLVRNPSELDGDEVRMLIQRAAAMALQGH